MVHQGGPLLRVELRGHARQIIFLGRGNMTHLRHKRSTFCSAQMAEVSVFRSMAFHVLMT